MASYTALFAYFLRVFKFVTGKMHWYDAQLFLRTRGKFGKIF
jgi:hypothetical protein